MMQVYVSKGLPNGIPGKQLQILVGSCDCTNHCDWLFHIQSSGIRPDGRNIHGGREVTINVGKRFHYFC